MKRATALVCSVALLTTGLTTAASAAPPTEPGAGMVDGLGAVSEWLAGLATHEGLGAPVPLTGVSPGSADALAIDEVFGPGGDVRTTIGAATTVADLVADLNALDGTTTPSGVDLDVVATDTTTDVVAGIDLQITLSRLVTDAPLVVVDDTATPPIDIRSGGTGVPLRAQLDLDLQARFDDVTDEFWLAADPGISGVAGLDSDAATAGFQAFDFPASGFDTVVGISDASITDASALSVATSHVVSVVDADGDGRLAFLEKAADGVTYTPGELTLPKTENVGVASTIDTAAGTLHLATSLIPSPAPTFDPRIDVALAGGAVTLTPSADYTDAFGMFTSIDATELLGGLGQLANLVDIVQNDPIADVDLPFLDADLSDVTGLVEPLKALIVELTEVDDPATVTNEFGLATFATVQEFVAAMNAFTMPGGASPFSVPAATFDPTTGLLDLPLTMTQALPADFQDITVLQVDPETLAVTEHQLGRVELGDTLKDQLGLDALGGFVDADDDGEFDVVDGTFVLAPPTGEVKSAFAAVLDWGVDLTPSVACDPPTSCDLPHTDLVESETLPVYQRFFLRDASVPEFTGDTLLQAAADSLRGLAGFVDVAADAGSLLQVGKVEGAQPSWSLDLQLGGTGITRIQEFTHEFAFSEDDTTGGTVPADLLAVTHNLDASGLLNLGLRGAHNDVIELLGNTHVPVELSWGGLSSLQEKVDGTLPTLTVDNLAAPLTQALAAVNFDPDNPTAMLGTLLDHLEAVATALDGALAVGDFTTTLPLVSTSLEDLASQFRDLQAAITDIRNADLPDPDAPGEFLPTPNRLRDLLEQLESLLGTDVPISIQDLGSDGIPEVVLDLQWSRSLDEAVPIGLSEALSAAGIPLAGVGASGTLDVTGTADAVLAMPIELVVSDGVPSNANVQIDPSSGLTVAAGAALDQSDELTLNALGTDITIGPGGEAELGVGGSVTYTGGASTPISLADYLSSLDVSLTPDTTPSCAVAGDAVPAIDAALLCVNVPVFVDGDPATVNGDDDADGDGSTADTVEGNDHYLQLAIDSLGAAPTTEHFPEGFVDKVVGDILSFDSLTEGLNKLLDVIAAALRGDSFGGALPMFGDDLDGAADIVDDFQTHVVGAIDEVLDLADATADATAATDTAFADFRQALVDSGLLQDVNGGGVATDDVVVNALCGGGAACLAGETVAQLTGVEVAFALGQGDPTNGDPSACAACAVEEIVFDLGLPALDVIGLDAGATLQAGAGWELEVGFGVSRTEGFYVLENPTALLHGAANDDDPELRVGAFAGLPSGIADVLELRFGLLAFGVDTGAGTSATNIRLESNLEKPGGSGEDDHILLHELPTLVAQPVKGLNPVLDGSAELDFELKAAPNSDLGLPELAASFDFAWAFSSQAFDEVGPPTISLNNVRVELGSIFNETLGPIADEIRRITEVADPVREFVFAPIPVISDLSRLFGGPDVTFVDLAEVFGEVDLGLLKDINDVLDFVSLITGSLAEGYVSLSDIIGGSGEVAIKGDRALGAAPMATQVLELLTFDGASAGPLDSIEGDVADHAASEGEGEASDKVLGSDAFALPFLDDPSCILGMLLKGDCVIVEWTPQDLYLDFEYEQPFGPFFGVLYVTVGGHAGAGIQFGMGFSTRGARQAVERSGAFTADVLSGVGAILLEGVFITDFEGPELYVTAGINAGAKLDVLIAEAGARGGIDATLGFDLIDGPEVDGRVYFDEMRTRIFNPLCLFEVVGFLEAFLEVYVELGACPFCVEKSFELARVRLLDFKAALAECDATPDLAREVGTGSDLHVRLNIGPDNTYRGVFENIIDEQYVVREIRAPDGSTPGLFSISAFGVTEEHEGFWIDFDAGTGDDVLLFQGTKAGAEDSDTPFDEQAKGAEAQAPFTAPVIGDLGPGNDAVTTGDGPDDIVGDTGNDQITTLGGADKVDGGDDDDTIDGGAGDDNPLLGGNGTDTINGGPGADRIDGGDGDDRIDGGRDVVDNGGELLEADGADTILGGFDNDVIFAGSGGDTVYGDLEVADPDDATGGGDVPGDDDEIHGEDGDDTIYAGPGDDVVLGDEADDPEVGRSYEDTVYGQGGADVVEGAWGHDELHGGPGGDIMSGTDGADDLFGDSGVDHLFGDVLGAVDPAAIPAGIDLTPFQQQLGTPDNDYLDGGADGDQLFGDDGNDRIRGNGGGDTIQGGPGRDLVVGDDGVITPGPGSPQHGSFDSWSTDVGWDEGGAGDGEDTIYGGPGDDLLYGEGAIDRIRGSAGADVLFGNAGNDLLYGDTGNDTAHGNADDDVVEGGPDDDLLVGNAGEDTIYGQAGHDRMIGGSGAGVGEEGVADTNDASDTGDHLYGGQGTDLGIGDNGELPDLDTVVLAPSGAAPGTYGDDELNGDADNDTLHGQDGDDDLWGGGGRDQLFGELGDDDLFGQSGEDYLVGDQATIVPVARTVTEVEPGGAPVWAVLLVDATAGGEDHMYGDSGDDHMWGGAATDTMAGGLGDDWMEGNGGADEMYGLSATFDDGVGQPSDILETVALAGSSDQDDMIGGSSDVNPDTDKLDEGELVMHGNAHVDVMTGDNANITRLRVDGDDTQWATDPVTLGRAREVQLLDRERRDPADLAPVSGADLMLGNGGNDQMFGQGDDDLLKGNGEDDQLQGNQGRDVLEGNAGEDDLIGGTDLLASTVVDVGALGLNDDAGDPDDGDWLFGGAGADVLAGDNSVIRRLPEDGVVYDYTVDLLGVDDPRYVLWLDATASPASENHGGDQLSGGTGVDVEFGQDDRDFLSGGPDDDYQEGNGDSDLVWGDTLLSELPVEGVDTPIALPDGGGDVAVPPIVHTLAIDDGHLSAEPDLNGGAGPDGQDDQLGGSSEPGVRDGGDYLFGDGAQDFQLGDNGELVRTIQSDAYVTYVDANPETIVRAATRYDVGPEGDDISSGDDWIQGDDDDDAQWGQDGDDQMFGDDALEPGDSGNDDMYGELGDDRMFGGPAEDAMVGDRGLITNTRIDGGGQQVSVDTQGPAFFVYHGLLDGQLDRRVDLLADGDGDVDGDGDDVEFPGLTFGGRDFMRGGDGHDSMHGAFGSDWMNGDSDGDWLFGADGDDAMWGGQGEFGSVDPTAPVVDDDGSDPLYLTYVDFLFGGHGADVLDFRPRPAGDDSIPADFADEATVWREITDIQDPDDATDNQHHQGVDWIFGGFDRDVLQGDVGKNGPEEFGDRLIDLVGAYNLFTRCNESYGDDGDLRQRDPGLDEFIHVWAYGSGIGASLDDVYDPDSSAYRELGFVFRKDTRANNGSAHDGTPGNFFDTACLP